MLPAERLGKELGLRHLLLKDESRNPTGSFIDRGATVLVSLAKGRGIKECSCTTTGNLGASLAAYCAKAGISARIRIHPATDRGKLYQMLAFGAKIEGPSRSAERHSQAAGFLSVDAGNPFLLEGEKTTCFETVQELGWKAPDVMVVPVGTGGHLSMIWRALEELRNAGLVERSRCRLLGVQLSGYAPIVGGRASARSRGLPDSPYTELEESEPLFKNEAVKAMAKSGGIGLTTTAAETVAATTLLAKTEGIFAEPASASVIACLQKAISRGVFLPDDTVVCVVTGAGLKDTKAISRLARATRSVSAAEDYTIARVQVGETKLAILRMLVGRRRYGYDLWQELSQRRTITTASVYQHLSELEALALLRKAGIAEKQGRDRVLYDLTKRGSELLKVAARED